MRWVWLVGLAACWSDPRPAPPAAEPVIGELAVVRGAEVRIVAITAHGLAVTRTVIAPEEVARIAWSGHAPIVLLARSHAVGEIAAVGYTPLRPIDRDVWRCDGERESELVRPPPPVSLAQPFLDIEGKADPTWDLLRDAAGAVWVHSCAMSSFEADCFEGCSHYARIAPRPFTITEDAPTAAPQYELPAIAATLPVCVKPPRAEPVALAPALFAVGDAVIEGCRATDLRYTVGPHGHVAVFDRDQLRVLIRGRAIGTIRGGQLVAFAPR